jgi:hypothetical protein
MAWMTDPHAAQILRGLYPDQYAGPAIRIRCASRGDCCRRDIGKDAAILAAHRAGYPRSRRGAENDNNLSVPVNGRPAPNGLEEPGGRDDAEAFEVVSPADTETGYSAP